MNSEFSDDMDLFQLERELQSLTPAAPRRELVQAIKARMEPVPRREARGRERGAAAFPWRRMVAPAAAAAAAVAVFNIDDNRRDGGKTAPVAGNDVASTISWEPMPMIAEYREYLNKGYFINPYNPNLELLHPQYRGMFFNAPVFRFQDENDGTQQVSFPQKRYRFIAPANYEQRPSLRVE